MNRDSTAHVGHQVVPTQRGAQGEVEVSAVERYKEIVALAAESYERMRDNDRRRVAELLRRLAETQELMARVIEQERDVRIGVSVVWDQAVEALWDERWLEMKPMPAPDESVPRRPQNDYTGAMDHAYQQFEDALQKRSLLRRKG
ncbi:hypothetical protein [Actinosynnema sp. NPDC020468]|uniref:hypothetical protein n=1 Tax=Actinosynnema sp. NPDC020468 TaxID=3154488 RepID=UPI0033DA98A7